MVGIPVLRRYDLLDQCVQGVLKNPGMTESDIYIIDNGGQYKKNNSKINVITPQVNLGVSTSWNMLFQLADDIGKDMLILNDDVVIAEDTISEVENTDADAVFAFAFGAFCIRKIVRDRVGYFDEFLWPMYWEDCDYYWRMRLVYGSMDKFIRLDYSKCKHLNGGSQTRHGWLIPWEDRVKKRIYRKWGEPTGDCGLFTLTEAYGGNKEDYFQIYWDECYNNSNGQVLDQLILVNKLIGVKSILIAGLEVGVYTMASMLSGVSSIYGFDPNRNPEFDYMYHMCRYKNVQLELVQENFNQEVDVLLVVRNYHTREQLDRFNKYATKYIICVESNIEFPSHNCIFSNSNLRIYAKNTI